MASDVTVRPAKKRSPPPAAAAAGGGGSQRRRHRLEAWLILTPVLLYLLLFSFLPVIMNFALSWTSWNGIVGSPQWVGADNYLRYLHAPYPLIIVNTVVFTIGILVVQTGAALLIALALNEKVFARVAHRAIWYVPTLTSAAITAQLAVIFFSPSDGVLNRILTSLGQEPLIWTTDPTWSRIIVIVFSVWRGIGGPVILFLAGLQSIDPQIFEAAQVDGASAWGRLRHLTIPLLKPMTVFVLVTGTIAGFQLFEAVLLMTKGGPMNQTNVMLVQIYNDAFVNADLGLASAGTVIMAVILLFFSVVMIRSMHREDDPS